MGYYTRYDFSNNSGHVIEEIEKVSGYGKSDDGVYYDVKWYDWHQHMLQVSKEFPKELILVEGMGEEQGDVWKAFFKSGKSEVVDAVLTFPQFDLKELD